MRYYILLIILLVYLLISCEKNENKPDQYSTKNFSFFVAGHVYSQSGIYLPFKEKFEYITNDTSI